MGRAAYNRLTIEGSASELAPLYEKVKGATDPDGFVDELVEYIADAGSRWTVGHIVTVYEAEADPERLALAFAMKGVSYTELARAVSEALPEALVALYVEEFDALGVLSLKWRNGRAVEAAQARGALIYRGKDKLYRTLVRWNDGKWWNDTAELSNADGQELKKALTANEDNKNEVIVKWKAFDALV